MEDLAERMGDWGTPWHEFAAFVFFGAVRTLLGYGIYLLLVLFIAYREQAGKSLLSKRG